MNQQQNYTKHHKEIFEFRGVYLPAEVILNKKLDKTCCIIFDMIKHLDNHKLHCWANNRYFADILNLSLTTISTSISLLSKLDYIEIKIQHSPHKGNKRIINISPTYKAKYKYLVNEMNDRYLQHLKDDDDTIAPFKSDYTPSLNPLKRGGKESLKHIRDIKVLKTKGIVPKELASKEANNETDVSSSAPSKINRRYKEPLTKAQLLSKAKLNMPIKEKKYHKPYEASTKALHLMKYWEGKNLKSISHNPEMKTYKQSLMAFDKLLSGKVFNGTEYEAYENKKFTLAEIRKVIDHFALMAFHHDYEPRNHEFKKLLSKMYPSVFIYSDFKTSNGYGRSYFIHCLENEPKIVKEKDVIVEDQYPNTTKAITKGFQKRILGGGEIEFTNDDLNSFRKASNFANGLFLKNRNRLMGSYADMKPYQIADCLFEALERSGVDMVRVKPYWLCNSAMQKQLPAYLYQSAILKDVDGDGQIKAPHYYDFGKPFEG